MKKILTIIIVCAVAIEMLAVPAKRTGRTMVDAEGNAKTVYAQGDENGHYLVDERGVWLDEKSLLPMDEATRKEKIAEHKERSLRRAVRTTGVDRLLAPRGPVILVSFSDTVFQDTQEGMREWAMGEDYSYGGATGSIHQYFLDVSGGQYDLQLDIIGPVQLSKSFAYYGENNSSGYDLHPDEMVIEACRLAADQGADFSQYDSDGDGKVDFVVIIYAGYGEADHYPDMQNTIWPHQDDLSRWGKSLQLHGKNIDHYCCLNELDGETQDRCGIGTFCHEFGHIMGLPDIYSTSSNASHKTLGQWDIMDYGCYNNGGNTPPAYSAYERWWMGWMEPTLLNEATSVTLNPLYPSGGAGYITENGNNVPNILRPNPTVFYVIENRQQTGWDEFIPGHGMLVTKINYHYNWWSGNTVNYSASNMGIDLIEADGLAPSYNRNNRFNGYFGKQGDAYPTSTVTSFTAVSGYQVTNIAETDGVITFDVNGGGSHTYLDTQELNSTDKPVKVLRDGQVCIIRGGRVYDLMGRMTAAQTPVR